MQGIHLHPTEAKRILSDSFAELRRILAEEEGKEAANASCYEISSVKEDIERIFAERIERAFASSHLF